MKREQFLSECVEYKVRKKELFWCFFPNICMVFVLLPILGLDDDGWWIYLLLHLIVFVIASPFLIYVIIKMKRIVKYIDDFTFYEVVLSKMHSSFRGKAYFTVEIDYQMKRYKVDTKPIFTTTALDMFYLQLEDYMNKKAVVAYNPVLNEVVVVKRT